MQNLYVRNWSKFQHYKNRNPPWIKLHFELLSSRDWVMLDDAGKLLAVACMLIASRNDGQIPYDSEYIKRVTYITNVDLKPLIECGFLELSSDCKQMLASARPEKEAETERDTEQSKKKNVFMTAKGTNYGREKTTGTEEGKRISDRYLAEERDISVEA